MANFLYVDNSNVWIAGMYVSAVKSGIAPDLPTAMQFNVHDQNWRLDYGRLIEFAGGDRKDRGRAVLYGSQLNANDSLWDVARRQGFEVVVHQRHLGNRERKRYTQATRMTVC